MLNIRNYVGSIHQAGNMAIWIASEWGWLKWGADWRI